MHDFKMNTIAIIRKLTSSHSLSSILELILQFINVYFIHHIKPIIFYSDYILFLVTISLCEVLPFCKIKTSTNSLRKLRKIHRVR